MGVIPIPDWNVPLSVLRRIFLILHTINIRLAGATLDAELCQDARQRAKGSKAALEQVQADKGGEPQKVFADKQRAGFNPQREGQQDKESCDDADDAFGGHMALLK